MREPHPCSTLPTRNLFPQRLASVVCLQSTALGQGLGRSTFNVAYSVVGGRDIPSRSRIVRAAWRLDGPRRGRPSRSAQYIPGRSARRRRGSSAPPERRTSRPCAQAVTSGLLASGGRSTRCDTPAHAPGVAVAPHESGHGRSSTPCGSARGIAPRCSPRSRHQDVVYRRTPRRKASANEIEGKC